MEHIILGSLIISILHGLLPNHWLPIISVGKDRNWKDNKILRITALAALAHTGSTVILGVIIAFVGQQLSSFIHHFTFFIAPAILILLGIWFIVQHYRHKHFHLDPGHNLPEEKSEKALIIALTSAMFFSPCLEIEGIYLQAGTLGWLPVLYVSVIYLIFSILGMILWVYLSLQGLKKIDWHKIEHISGIISGAVLILMGLMFIFLH